MALSREADVKEREERCLALSQIPRGRTRAMGTQVAIFVTDTRLCEMARREKIEFFDSR